MKYKKLGRTGLKVSELCLGCLQFGEKLSPEASLRIVDHAWEAGVTFFDTADYYAGLRSETILGEVLKGRRDQAIIGTKAYGRTGPGPNDMGLSRKHIMDAVEGSLRRLQTDYIDLYSIHRPDPDTPIEETLRALDDLVHQGKVRYIGCSNFLAWELGKALWLSDVHNLARLDAVQPRYSLICRQIEDELLPLCASEGIGINVYNPLAGGLLTGKHAKAAGPAEDSRFSGGGLYAQRYWNDAAFAAVGQLRELSERFGKSMIHLATGWVLANPVVTTVLMGFSREDQLAENLLPAEQPLNEEELAALESVEAWPRPPEPPQPSSTGSQARQYAWVNGEYVGSGGSR